MDETPRQLTNVDAGELTSLSKRERAAFLRALGLS